ncbi:hypothetical protein L6452_22854 [Arctium lappa]|uniref:Uncharacterized protein n=1 Tax=Arctium lappa TaxID=4217 RepID=A0ACB9B0Y9_ARCLA|nr:hypothetical protein L6452_22854 [Arctium lappa]
MPTGRYTNGRTIVDILGQEVGFKDYTLPFLAPTTVGPLVLRGVNYASGGGGILNHTGKIFVGRINLDAQLDNFAKTRQDITLESNFLGPLLRKTNEAHRNFSVIKRLRESQNLQGSYEVS